MNIVCLLQIFEDVEEQRGVDIGGWGFVEKKKEIRMRVVVLKYKQ